MKNMARFKGRILVGFLALLVLMTGIVAAGQAPILAASTTAEEPDINIIAHAGQADFGLAALSILLGGGMFYLFRPIRRIPIEIRFQ
jgi:hypothetical protein